jgi:hypothetical protein
VSGGRLEVRVEADVRLEGRRFERATDRVFADERVKAYAIGYDGEGEPLTVEMLVAAESDEAARVATAVVADALPRAKAGAAIRVTRIEPEAPPHDGPPFFVLVEAGEHADEDAQDRLLAELLDDARIADASTLRFGDAELSVYLPLDVPRPRVDDEARTIVEDALRRAGLAIDTIQVGLVCHPDGRPV